MIELVDWALIKSCRDAGYEIEPVGAKHFRFKSPDLEGIFLAETIPVILENLAKKNGYEPYPLRQVRPREGRAPTVCAIAKMLLRLPLHSVRVITRVKTVDTGLQLM